MTFRTDDVAVSDENVNYRLVAEHSTDIVFRVRLDGVIEWVSPNIQEVLGFDPTHWVGRPGSELIPPDHRAEFLRQTSRALASEVDARFEVPVLRADGTSVWMESAGRMAKGVNGEPLFRVVRMRDIDEQRATQQRLAQSEALFRSAMTNASIGMCLIAPDGSFLRVNAALCELLDRAEATLLTTSWQEMTHPEDLQGDLALVGEILAGDREAYRLTKRYLRPDGEVVWGDLSVSAVRNESGGVQFFISQIADITAAVNAMESEQASRARYQILAENASDVVFRSGPDRLLRWLSPSVTRVLGWTAEELVGTRMTDLWRPAAATATEAARTEVYSGLQEATGTDHLFELRAKNGIYHWFSGRAVPLFDERGDPDGVMAGLKSVDDLVRANSELDRERSLLRAVMDSELDARVRLDPIRDPAGAVVDFIYGDANPAALAYLRHSFSDLVGSRLLTLFPGQSALFPRYVDVIESGTPLVLDDVEFASDVAGTTRRFDFRGVAAQGSLSLTWRDVTADYEAALAVQRSEAHFRMIAENATDVVFLTNGLIIGWVSPSITRLLGWNPTDWTGHTLMEFVHPDDVDIALRSRTAIFEGSTRLTRFRLKMSGEGYVWIEIHAAPVRDDDGHVTGIEASFRGVDDQVAAEAQLVHQANHDQLTGLMNRDQVYQRVKAILAHEPRTGDRTLLAFADLDNLKDVNDRYGHSAGDTLIRDVASRIATFLRDEDLVARIGGDEFLLVLTGIRDMGDGPPLLERLLKSVNQPLGIAGATLHPRMSIGLAEITPGDDLESAVTRADTAMYAAKRAGGNRVELAVATD